MEKLWGRERRAFSLKRAILSLKGLEPSSSSCCKHWHSGRVSQVCPKVGCSRSWAATQTSYCCRPGGMNREPGGKPGTEPEKLILFQIDGWLWMTCKDTPWALSHNMKSQDTTSTSEVVISDWSSTCQLQLQFQVIVLTASIWRKVISQCVWCAADTYRK